MLPPATRFLSTTRALAQETSSSPSRRDPLPEKERSFPCLVGPPPPPLPDTRYGLLPKEKRPILFPFAILHSCASSAAETLLAYQTSPEYMVGPLRLGASFAAERVVEALSQDERSFMKRVMTEDLYDRLTQALDQEVSVKDDPSSSSSSPLHGMFYRAIKDARIVDIWIHAGSASVAREKNLVPRQAFTLSCYAPPERGPFSLMSSFVRSMDDGVRIEVDIEITGVLHYKGSETTRASVWRFSSPHFPSDEAMKKAWSPVTGGSWQWKVSDIEGFMEREAFEARMRQARLSKATQEDQGSKEQDGHGRDKEE